MDAGRVQRESVNAPGWKWVAGQGAYVWWDGQRYTARAEWDGSSWDMKPVAWTPPTLVPRPTPAPRPHATRLARSVMVGLITTGCVTLAAGATRVEEKDCDVSEFTYTDASGAWLPWLVLACLAGFGVMVWRRWAPDVRWIQVSAILGVTAAAVVCPIVVAVAGAANCGL